MADQEGFSFDFEVDLFADLGYKGLTIEGATVLVPNKKPKGGSLTMNQKGENQLFASYRVGIEHVNSSIKRCRTVKDTLRLKTEGVFNLFMLLACSLHNFRLNYRTHQPLVLS